MNRSIFQTTLPYPPQSVFNKPEEPARPVHYDMPETLAFDSSSQTGLILKDEVSIAESYGKICQSHKRDLKDLSRYSEIISICPCPAFVDDESGKCILANKSFLEIVGCEIDDMRGDGWQRLVDPEVRERIVIAWEKFIKGETRRFDLTYAFIHLLSKRRTVCRVVAGKINGGSAFVGFVTPL